MARSGEGGCLCGAVRYRVQNQPARAGVCHCTFCQRRTGSAFGIGLYFKEEDVTLNGGELKTYEHKSDETGRWLRMQFCPNCGTTVTWTIEALPGLRAVAAGTLDDPKAFRIGRHSWLRSKHPWFTPPAGVETFEQSALPPGKPAR